ncbi:MAG: tRNA (adenosine(37)-N6)-threonylcarbamoyltransferase complex dimerization subunit type 1 TsaB [Mariprofundaceae bacterium]|nr:tRNA (adenosine(37)-N6)-threonylcarbamoyltransferase complex dimerization subunit type 1 TsaB [Mariprofundaceae bacterium]
MTFPVLALDAAFGPAAASLMLDEECRLYAEGTENKPHSQAILPMLEQLLQQASLTWESLSMLALGIGPGSFTGVRVAAATLAGINAGLKRPLLTVSSLAVTAAQTGNAGEIWVLEDAHAGEVYVGHYQGFAAMDADTCMAWEALGLHAPAAFVCHGTPPQVLADWQHRPLVRDRPEALADMVLYQLHSVTADTLPTYPQPAYLQPSQAERNFNHG